MNHQIIEILATWFKLGNMKKAPGTWGTLGALPLAALLLLLPPYYYMGLVLVLCVGAIFICDVYEKTLGTHDASQIVLDEVVGYLVAVTWLPLHWTTFVSAFVVFRTLDILKPFPISFIDKNMKGGWGVVMDDVLAGLITNVILQVLFIYLGFSPN